MLTSTRTQNNTPEEFVTATLLPAFLPMAKSFRGEGFLVRIPTTDLEPLPFKAVPVPALATTVPELVLMLALAGPVFSVPEWCVYFKKIKIIIIITVISIITKITFFSRL